MMRRYFLRIPLITVIALLFQFSVNAQSFEDNALLFGRTRPGGSARIQALGGAQISLGGDFSSALSNPAGLGMYNRSEFTFSPALNFLNTTSNYSGNSERQNNSYLNIPAVSFVGHHSSKREKGFLGGSFGISATRINDLHQDYTYSGDNANNSIIDYFEQYSGDVDPNSLLQGGDNYYDISALAYNNYLTQDQQDNVGYYYTSALDPLRNEDNNPIETRTVKQAESIQRSGSQYQWSIAYGANISDKFFFGANIGLTTLNYKLKQSYTESNFRYVGTPESKDYKPLDHFTVDENLTLKGSGINATLGVIYRPISLLQFGASVVTPTYYQVEDTYSASVSSLWNNFDYNDDGSLILNDVSSDFLNDPTISDYVLTTPLKMNLGGSVLTKYGFLTADVEFVNYSKTKYSRSNNDNSVDIGASDHNANIRSAYNSVINYRIGAEGRYDIFRLRLGYNFMADPYRLNDIDRSIQSVSGGVGVKTKSFFADMAIVTNASKGNRSPYSVGSEKYDPKANLNVKGTNVIFTVGFTF